MLGTILGTGFSIDKFYEEFKNAQVSTENIANDMVVPGGMPIGIYMKTDGILVLGTDYIEGFDGQLYNPSQNLVKAGDYIIGINGDEVASKKELISKLEKIDSGDVVLQLRRKEECIDVKINPAISQDNSYKIGIWVKDSIQGLGTVTYLTKDKRFGALGHGIHDTDTDELLDMGEGRVYKTAILRIEKGKKGSPGGMEGMIIYNRYNLLGEITKNTNIGVYGIIYELDSLAENQAAIPVCRKEDVREGKAIIRCAVTGKVEEYEIEIEKINRFVREENKGMVIRITDERLLEITGGIVQGMSGSPIIQNGKLVGAVTHVLVNDPTRGYGIFIENMLEVAS